MASRFYFGTSNNHGLTPGFDAAWEQTGQAVRRDLFYKPQAPTPQALTNSTSVTIPITTTQDILIAQFISAQFRQRVRIDNRPLRIITRCDESATSANAHLAFSVRILQSDNTTYRGTLASNFATSSEFPTTDATRLGNTPAAITALTVEPLDRLVVEIGIRANAPSAAGSGLCRFGFVTGADFAYTSGLTTDLNPWIEFEQDLFESRLNNYQFVQVGNGMASSGRIR